MLINTVILFLKDALPVAITIAIILVLLGEQKNLLKNILLGCVIGLGFSVVFINYVDLIAQLDEGNGLELFSASIYIAVYLLCLALLYSKCFVKTQYGLGFLTCTLITFVMFLNGSNLMVYITGYWSQSGAVNAIVLGVLLGLGISVSVAILLYFSVFYCQQKISHWVSSFILLLFASGQIIHASNLLLPIDYLPESELLWNTNHVVSQTSEFGHFLTAFIGYEASPTSLQFMLYVFVFLIPVIFMFSNRAKFRANVNKEFVF